MTRSHARIVDDRPIVCQIQIGMLCFPVRIIAGTAKGRPVKMPQGTVTRPATDLVRSAVFSMLESMGPDWSRALDLFAGSGAVGLEALSRGAGRVDFVDQDRRCCATIKENAATMGFASRVRIYCSKVSKALSLLEGKYGIVFLDPPYADDSLASTLTQLEESTLVERDSIIVAMHSARRSLADSYGRLNRLKERRHGDTIISLYTEEAVP